MSRKLEIAVAASLAVLVAGCAGTLSRFFKKEDSLPSDVPQEMQQKFEIRDASEPEPTPAPAPSPSASPSPAPAVVAGSEAKVKPGKKGKAPRRARGKVRGKGKENSADGGESALAPGPGPSPSPQSVAATARFPNRRPEKEPIWLGEKLVYEVTYFGVTAGDFTLEALPLKAVAGRRVYHLRGSAHTSKVFSLFYKLDDMAETFVDFEGVFSHRFHISLNETKQTRDSVELYDYEKSQTFYWNRWERPGQPLVENKVFKPIDPMSQDTLSSLYFLRTVPLPDGAVVDFPVVSESNTVYAHVTVIRREDCDTPIGKKRCVVLKPEAKTHGVLTKKGDSFMWLTDDDRRFLIRLEAKVKVGTVVANLKALEPGTPPQSP